MSSSFSINLRSPALQVGEFVRVLKGCGAYAPLKRICLRKLIQ